MSKGGSKQTQTTAQNTTTNQTQAQDQSQFQGATNTTDLDPRLADLLYGNANRATQMATQPYQPYTGPGVMGAYQAAQDVPNVTAMGYAPQMQAQTVMGPASQASASQGYQNLDHYMNPYLNDVVGATQQDGERARQMARMTTEGQAQAAGAFGGSRHGVADALTDSESLRNLNSLTANLRNTGWNTALGASMADADRSTNVSQYNAGANNQTAAQNAAMEAQRAAANHGALNSAAQFNVNTNQAAQGQNQQAALARAGMLGQLGSADYSQYNDARNYGLSAQQVATQAAGLVPNYGTQTQSGYNFGSTNGTMSGTGTMTGTGTTTLKNNPGFLGTLGQIAQTGGQLATLFSDERLKTNIKTIGRDARGRRWASYEYVWAPGRRELGVIAQEVIATDPNAVSEFGGFLMVDYAKLDAA